MTGENNFIHDTAIVDHGCQLGDGVKVWHFSHLMATAKIGNHVNIGQNVFIANGVTIGNNVKIQNNVSLYTGVECDDDVFIGPSVVFTNVINPRSTINRKSEYQKTKIERGVSIGANSTIICGHTIGQFAMIGAGTVVTKSVKAYALVYGNPAKQHGWVGEFGNKLIFDEYNLAFCQETMQQYRLENNLVVRIQ